MYFWSPPPAPPPPPLPPHAATASVIGAAASAAPNRRLFMSIQLLVRLISGRYLSGFFLAHHVGVHRDEDDAAENHVLPFLRDRHDLQAVVQHGDDQCPDHGSDDGALAAGQRRTADDNGRDRLQFVPHPGGWLR